LHPYKESAPVGDKLLADWAAAIATFGLVFAWAAVRAVPNRSGFHRDLGWVLGFGVLIAAGAAALQFGWQWGVCGLAVSVPAAGLPAVLLVRSLIGGLSWNWLKDDLQVQPEFQPGFVRRAAVALGARIGWLGLFWVVVMTLLYIAQHQHPSRHDDYGAKLLEDLRATEDLRAKMIRGELSEHESTRRSSGTR
jgi:hypothetical protein